MGASIHVDVILTRNIVGSRICHLDNAPTILQRLLRNCVKKIMVLALTWLLISHFDLIKHNKEYKGCADLGTR